jgi:hypothetical protein
MKILLLLLLMTVIGAVTYLDAVVIESTASLSGLNGITMLSSNPGDHAFSPLIGSRGISYSLCNNFSTALANVYGLGVSDRAGIFHLASGIRLQNAEDFRWQDQYASVAVMDPGNHVGIGATLHLDYLKAGNSPSAYNWSWDAACKADWGDYGMEFRLIRMDSEDRQLHITAVSRLYSDMAVATTYIWGKNGYASLRTASSYTITDDIVMQTSWQSNPSRFGAGLQIRFDNLNLGYAIRTHSELDLTHCFDLGSR